MKTPAITALLMGTVLLGATACTATPAPAGDPGLLIWVDATREPAAQAYAASVEGEVDVTVEVVDDVVAKIALMNQTGSGWPDVAWSAGVNAVATFADNGFAAPLDDLVSQEIFDGYGTANSWCELDGTTYCLRNDLAQTVLWYDTVIFDELGLTVPTTMDEFVETALKLEGTGYVAGTIGSSSLYTGFLQASGCPLADAGPDMTVRIDPEAEECTRVVEALQPLLDAKVLETRSPFDAGFIADVAQAGKVAMTIGPSWWGDFVMKPAESWAIPAGRIAAAPPPSWDGVEQSGAWGGGMWIVSSHSEFLQQAADAAAWLVSSPEVQTDAPTYPAYGPANEVWAERISTDDYYADDVYPAMVASAQVQSTVDKAVLYEIYESEGSALQPALDSGASLADAFSAFAAAVIQSAEAAGYSVSK